MEFLTCFRAHGKEYELYKNHHTDMYFVGNMNCGGTGLVPAFQDYESGEFHFTIYSGYKPLLRTIPKITINKVGSL